MAETFFAEVPGRVPFGGPDTTDPLAYMVYDPDRVVLGKRMEDHLRIAVCLWHSFAWPGSDVFGVGTFDRPWLAAGVEPMECRPSEAGGGVRVPREARRSLLHVPRPRRGAGPRLVEADQRAAGRGRRRDRGAYGAGRACGSCGAPPTCSAIRGTWPARRPTPTPRCSPTPRRRSSTCSRSRSGSAARTTSCGAGARATTRLLNTDLVREERQFARFLTLVAEHKHRIGFEGALLIEPKPQEPAKHQYDYDSATVHGFLAQHGLEGEYRVNLEANHATLAGHSFHHEVATAVALGIFGSIDANRGDYQNGWDTDQFPNSVDELALAVYEILKRRRVHDRRLQLRREASAAVDRADGPVPCPHRRHRHAGAGAARRR